MKALQYLNNPAFKARMPKFSAAASITAVVSCLYLTLLYPNKVLIY